METITTSFLAFKKLFKYYFGPDTGVMSDEAKKIFSNDEDRKKYTDAVDRLKKNPNEKQTIELSTKEKITLVS